MTLGPGVMLSHYRLVEKIGEGGMGVVYRARDETLDRDVALKVLPAGVLADNAARKRFRKEALSLSRLNHPNIETVHAFEAHEGVDFLVMEFIPGVTLDEKLVAGPLQEKEVTRLGMQLAEGLAAAHAQGVVHHDLKPGNLRLTTDGRLKILDFGLAKWLQPAAELKTTDRLGDTGSGAGTLPYMAPEQLKKDEADPRSDIYAAGAVLYEMATGRRPFPHTSPPRLIEAILNQTPPNPGALNPRISAALESIVVKAMDKAPERRYQTARELQVDLERLGAALPPLAPRRWRWPLGKPSSALAGGVLLVVLGMLVAFNVGGPWEPMLRLIHSGQIESVAVLPLENLSGDPEQEYFADGMTDELTTDLAQSRTLQVISRTSAMHYKGTRKPLPEIARELNVQAVVEGTVKRSGQRIRITAQLIEATTDRHLWAKVYERDQRDALALEGEVAQAIAQAIQANLRPQERARLTSPPLVKPEAHEAYLKATFFFNKVSAEGAKSALRYFEQAIAEDPNFAPAYSGLARTYDDLVRYEILTAAEAHPKAKAAVLRALEIDNNFAGAHLALATILYDLEWDWSGAERELRRALELNPNLRPAHNEYSYWLYTMGRPEEGLEEQKRSLMLDPISLAANINLAYVYWLSRQYDRSVEQYKWSLQIDPNAERAHMGLANTYAEKGMFKDAIAEAQKAIELSGADPEYVAVLGRIYAAAGKRGEALKILENLEELTRRKKKFISPVGTALIYAALGNRDQAFAHLDEAYQKRDEWLTDLKCSPEFDPLRSDPRFADLLRRAGLPVS